MQVFISYRRDDAASDARLLYEKLVAHFGSENVFLDVVDTGWSRDRDSTIVADESFGRITARLWSTLRTESQKSLASGQTAGAT